MQAEIRLTLLGELPDGATAGDVLTVRGEVTIHTVEAELVDVSTHNARGARAYLPTIVRIEAFANDMEFHADA